MSPFSLFMTKMKRDNPDLKKMPFSELVEHCDVFYKQLSPQMAQQIKQLSADFRLNLMTESELNLRLNAIDLNGKEQQMDGWNDTSNTNDIEVDSKPKVDDSIKEELIEEEEPDVTAILDNALNSFRVFKNETIVVVSFNILTKTMEGEYIPVEVGLTKFSVEEGIECFTKLIANEVPNGYFAKAKEFSAMFHKLPISGHNESFFEKDYRLLFDQIYDFISSSSVKNERNRKVIFCKAKNYSGLSDRNQVEGCLLWFDKWMRSNGQLRAKCFTDDFIVAELTDLLYLVGNKFGKSVTSEQTCVNYLNESTYDYRHNMRCTFHSEDDNNYCALAVAKRSALLFLKSLELVRDQSVEKQEPPQIGVGRGRLRHNLRNLSSIKTIN